MRRQLFRKAIAGFMVTAMLVGNCQSFVADAANDVASDIEDDGYTMIWNDEFR